ncbi:hypothetical protein K470DRAFT_295555 [Piedraia hortae CBS 480.64]|uniref:Uncharacterized protein n=1 Tax=Piedraia hortae CBS 480.64 TaxID=1314780 RepID=A0A6A7BXU8_9PEZI|nr:hypothetical protein K470DRAFT_295555 [Piedraia hortae CBS 480.64]
MRLLAFLQVILSFLLLTPTVTAVPVASEPSPHLFRRASVTDTFREWTKFLRHSRELFPGESYSNVRISLIRAMGALFTCYGDGKSYEECDEVRYHLKKARNNWRKYLNYVGNPWIPKDLEHLAFRKDAQPDVFKEDGYYPSSE